MALDSAGDPVLEAATSRMDRYRTTELAARSRASAASDFDFERSSNDKSSLLCRAPSGRR
jgi:hypothetical protein